MTPERFRQAREFAGLTQTELARRIEAFGLRKMAQGTIAGIETGRWEPSSEVVADIAKVTGFHPDFFAQPDPPDFPSGSLVLYRAKASSSARGESQVRRYAQLMMEVAGKLTARVPALPVRIPQLEQMAPVEAARVTRSVLGRSPDTPILDLMRTLEKAGVMMLAIPLSRDPIEAFSAWTEGRTPCIATLANSAADRQRYSIAHELGHLVMHRVIRGAHVEDEANAFAAEFLTPADALREEFESPVTLMHLLELKERWRVSVRSLINTAASVKAISQTQRSYLFKKVNKEFGGRSEPTHFALERPRGLMQLAEMVYGNPVDFGALAAEIHIPERRVRGLFEDYVAGSPDRGKLVTFPSKH